MRWKTALYKARRLRNRQWASARRIKRNQLRIERIMRRREKKGLVGKGWCVEQLEKRVF